MPQGDMMMGGMLGTDTNPIWVTADLDFNGQTWTNIGMRFKGNSSLMSTWGSGDYKLPFKLDFDKFEDDYPQIDNQRFYGFEQVSFSSNWSDDSLLRERITADIFREAGVPASHTAFYAVYVDYGEGPVYFGLYTAVEVVDDTVIETQFNDDNGNVYKPEGTGAAFAEGSFDEESLSKENNEDEADYSDVRALYDALHSETRTTDPEAWRSELESVFNADGFLRWLAVNTVVQNWDTYGQMAHNYYLYNNEGVLTWIPWDNNMAMMEGMGGGFMRPRDGENPPSAGGNAPGGGMPAGGGPGFGRVSLDLESVNDSWPLIRYLIDDPVYHDMYVGYVSDTINGVFAPEKVTARMQELHDLIAPYVAQETEGYTNLSSPEAFDTALTDLITHVNDRYTAAQEYIASQQ
jgi:spore coat protein CotH